MNDSVCSVGAVAVEYGESSEVFVAGSVSAAALLAGWAAGVL